jgi:hypothetical protein
LKRLNPDATQSNRKLACMPALSMPQVFGAAFRPGNGMASKASDPQDLVRRRAADRAPTPADDQK